jgi:hypothetical protein
MVPEKGERVLCPLGDELVLDGPLVLAIVVVAGPLPPDVKKRAETELVM